jgi:tripartite-type tricarboxylate transporter receptor subunit TctC
MMRRREFLASSLAVLGAPLLGSRAFAQLPKYADRPLRLIVPFAPGGGVDVFARLLAERLRQTHGFTILVENRAGANGSVGGMAVKSADPDGFTLLFSAGTHVMAQHVMKSAPYDPVADFAHIARVGEAPMMLVMAPNRAPNTLTEIIVEARNAPY